MPVTVSWLYMLKSNRSENNQRVFKKLEFQVKFFILIIVTKHVVEMREQCIVLDFYEIK